VQPQKLQNLRLKIDPKHMKNVKTNNVNLLYITTFPQDFLKVIFQQGACAPCYTAIKIEKEAP